MYQEPSIRKDRLLRAVRLSLYIAWIISSLPLLVHLLFHSTIPAWTMASILASYAFWICCRKIIPQLLRPLSLLGTVLGIVSAGFASSVCSADIFTSFAYPISPAHAPCGDSALWAAGITLGVGAAVQDTTARMPRKIQPEQETETALTLIIVGCLVLLGRLSPLRHGLFNIMLLVAAAIPQPDSCRTNAIKKSIRTNKNATALCIGLLVACCGCLDGLSSLLTNMPTRLQDLFASVSICAAGILWVYASRKSSSDTLPKEALPILACALLVVSTTFLAFGSSFSSAMGFLGEKTFLVITVLLLIKQIPRLCSLHKNVFEPTFALLLLWIAGSFLSQKAMALYHQGHIPSLVPMLLSSIFGVIITMFFLILFRQKSVDNLPNNKTYQDIQNLAVQHFATSYHLTPRETEVLYHLCNGYSLPAIGTLLNISPHTVDGHTRHIYEKTSVHRRDELMDLVQGFLLSPGDFATRVGTEQRAI